jgi:hypothetical protein
MAIRILNLDGSLTRQHRLLAEHQPEIIPAQSWGPRIRLACGFGRFRSFEADLASLTGGPSDPSSAITLYGSGDFHHVSLALLRRLSTPCNLLVLDNHPDWMRGVPFLHCGTWVYHAARLPVVQRIFHVGGEVDFDNYYGPLAPWSLLRRGKIHVFPAVRRFQRGRWSRLANEPLRLPGEPLIRADRLAKLLHPFATTLASHPLYVSLDKDVMRSPHAVVNWDSGHLDLDEVKLVVGAFLRLAKGKLAGLDITGDWSPVQLRGWLRHLMHLTEHPSLAVDPAYADRINAQTNLSLLTTILENLANKARPALLYG